MTMYEHRLFKGGELPSIHTVNGKVVAFKTDFRGWLAYERLREEPTPEEEAAALCVASTIDSAPADIRSEEIGQAMAWFYSCGDTERVDRLDIPPNIARAVAKWPPVSSLYWDFWQPWADIEALLVAVGATVTEGRGPRVKFDLAGQTAAFHRPHSPKTARAYQITIAREFLENVGVRP